MSSSDRPSPAYPAVVVGCGQVGSGYDEHRLGGSPLSHAGAYAAHARTELVAGVDSSAEMRARFERRWRVPTYASIGEVAEAYPAAIVSIAVPPEPRLDVLREVLAAQPAGIWMEKPIAANLTDGERIVAACHAAGVPVAVNFLRRFHPAFDAMAAEVGRAGSDLLVAVTFTGTFRNHGSHAVDLALWLLGHDLEVVAVSVSEPADVVCLRAPDRGTALLRRLPPGDVNLFEVDVWAGDARWVLASLGDELHRGVAEPSPLFDGVRVQRLSHEAAGEPGFGIAMTRAVDALIAAVESDREPAPTPTDGLVNLQVQAAIEQSLARLGSGGPEEARPNHG